MSSSRTYTARTRPFMQSCMAIAALLITACGSNVQQSQPSTTLSSPEITATLSSPSVSTSEAIEVAASTGNGATDNGGPQDMLSNAIDQLGTVYEFRSEIIVDGSQASLAIGRRLDNAIEVLLDQEGTPILYRSIDAQRWLQLPDGSWDRLTESAAPIDPLTRLEQPTALGLIASNANVTTMLAVYDATALSLASSGELTTTLTITDGKLSNIDFTGRLDGHSVEIHTSFSPTSNLEPIPTP